MVRSVFAVALMGLLVVGANGAELKANVDKAFKKVQKIENEAEPPGVDQWKLPKETMKDGKGDCEDKSFLLQKILIDSGIDSASVVFGYYLADDGAYKHVWVEMEIDGEKHVLDAANDVFAPAKKVEDRFAHRDLSMIEDRLFNRALKAYREKLVKADEIPVADRVVCETSD